LFKRNLKRTMEGDKIGKKTPKPFVHRRFNFSRESLSEGFF
jgi:hypothetical protein